MSVWFLLLYRRIHCGYPFRRIKLTRGKYAIVDPEDFEKLNRYKWNYSYYGYAQRTIPNKKKTGRKRIRIMMHRELCTVPKGKLVDHINRNSLDNRKVNLRPATKKQNVWNRKVGRRRWKTRFSGIRWDKNQKKWQVRLTVNGRRESFGCYADEVEAAKAYDKVAKKFRGEFAVLNFPD